MQILVAAKTVSKMFANTCSLPATIATQVTKIISLNLLHATSTAYNNEMNASSACPTNAAYAAQVLVLAVFENKNSFPKHNV